MPVSCFGENEEPPRKCCKFCDESTDSGTGRGGPVSWRLTLDQDLIDTLKINFPSWFPGDSTATGSTLDTYSDIVATTEFESLELLTPSPIAERSNGNSNSSVISTESGISSLDSAEIERNILSFRPSPISSGSSFSQSPNSLVIYATHIDQSLGQAIVLDMAEGHENNSKSLSGEPPQLHIMDQFSFNGASITRQASPPKAIVDSSPLQPAMDKNKESLKVKLLVRRPITQLVEQGIIPPLKTSPAIHEQRKQLERAKTGDLLKAKIQQRPNRQELERRHILEHEECHVDPSLAEKQRMLKKARLADQLNSQISHRPGPLELIKKNILHVEEPIERIVKEGLVTFKATSEGLLNRPQHPNSYVTFEDDSQNSSESGSAAGDNVIGPTRSGVLEVASSTGEIVTVALTIPTSGGAVVVTSGPILQTTQHHVPALIPVQNAPANELPVAFVKPPSSEVNTDIKTEFETTSIKSETPQRFAELCQSVVESPASISASPTLVPIFPTSNATFSFTCAQPVNAATSAVLGSPQAAVVSRSVAPSPQSVKCDAPGKDKYRKKTKCKPSATKARPIKFHEYKGPPNAQKSLSASQLQTEETSYQLLLKQQNFLLEYLEGLHKQSSAHQQPKPQILMMTETNFVQKPSLTATVCHPSSTNSAIATVSQQSPATAMTIASSNGPETNTRNNLGRPVDLNKLEKLKVSDLKLELKKRNLPVSGPKPQLIERLKPYLPLESGTTIKPESTATNGNDISDVSDIDPPTSPQQSLSPNANDQDMMEVPGIDSPTGLAVAVVAPQPQAVPPKEDLLREQQRKIDELQRKLRESQEELLQMKQSHTAASQVSQHSKEQQPVNQKLIFKQQLEAKIQKEKMQQIEQLQRQQKEFLANQQQVLKNAAAATAAIARNNKTLGIASGQSPSSVSQKADMVPGKTHVKIKEEAPALAFSENALQQLVNKNKNVEFVWNGEQTLFLVGVPATHQDQNNNNKLVGKQVSSFLVPVEATSVGTAATLMQAPSPILVQQKCAPLPTYQSSVEHLLSDKDTKSETKDPIARDQDSVVVVKEEMDRPNRVTKRVHRNSQMMTDVLEILIKNGDLPESAAQVPVTPTTAPQQPTINLIYNQMDEKTPSNSIILHTEPVSPPMSTEEQNKQSENPDDFTAADINTMLNNLNRPTNMCLTGELASADGNEDQVKDTLQILLNGHQDGSRDHQRLGNVRLGANDVVLNNSTVTALGKMDSGLEGICGSGIQPNIDRFMENNACPTEEMDHFDEFDFMMKLDMDIGDDSCHISGGTNEQHKRQEFVKPEMSFFSGFGHVQDNQTPRPTGFESDGGSVRNQNFMVQSESRESGSVLNGAGKDGNGNPVIQASNNRFTDETPMDVEVFSNSLSGFDFPFDVNDSVTSQMTASLHNQTQRESLGRSGDAPAEGTSSFAVGHANNGTANSSSLNFDSLPQGVIGLGDASGGLIGGSSSSTSLTHTTNSNHNHLSNVFGSMNSTNDHLGMADVPPSLLYDGHDYSLELFDDLRIPSESMSWNNNEMDFPIYGK